MGLSELKLVIRGIPAPKGSARAAGNQVIPSGSPQNAAALRAWGSCVREAAIAAVAAAGAAGTIPMVGVPIQLKIVWRMPRPRRHYLARGPRIGELLANAPTLHMTKPDSSKLLRALEDDLNGLVWDDDSRVAETLMRKIYASPGQEGATVHIVALETP